MKFANKNVDLPSSREATYPAFVTFVRGIYNVQKCLGKGYMLVPRRESLFL